MESLNPTYRIKINQNIVKYPLFFDFLRSEFHRIVMTLVTQENLDLSEKYNFTILLITHDMSVIRYLADRVAIMYLGEIVEIGKTY